jgi:hypothetical protein
MLCRSQNITNPFVDHGLVFGESQERFAYASTMSQSSFAIRSPLITEPQIPLERIFFAVPQLKPPLTNTWPKVIFYVPRYMIIFHGSSPIKII